MTVSVRYIGTLNPYFEIAVTGKPTKWAPGRTADVSDADAALLIATNLFEVYSDRVLPFVFDVSGAVVGVRLPSGVISPVSGSGSGVILSTAALTASGLIKTGPSKVYSVVVTSGSGKLTLRDGTTAGGALVAGWGGGGASGLAVGTELTANLPYSPGIPPTSYTNGIYAELSGTATFIVFYQ